MWNFIKKKEINKPIIVIYIFLSTPSTGSIMFYYMSNELKFSSEILGRLRVVSAVAGILGVILYNKLFSKSKFKLIVCTTTILCVLMSLSYLILIHRINISIGIPDSVFCFSDSLLS